MRKDCDSGYIIFDYYFSQNVPRRGSGGTGGGDGCVNSREHRAVDTEDPCV